MSDATEQEARDAFDASILVAQMEPDAARRFMLALAAAYCHAHDITPAAFAEALGKHYWTMPGFAVRTMRKAAGK